VDEHVDLVRLRTLNAYWAKSPPVHVAFASFIGWKPDAAGGAMNGAPIPASQTSGAILDTLMEE
jgi:hypothetical protein